MRPSLQKSTSKHLHCFTCYASSATGKGDILVGQSWDNRYEATPRLIQAVVE